MHCAFTSMDAKIGIPTIHTCGLKSIQQPYNIHTYLSVIASNVNDPIGQPGFRFSFNKYHHHWLSTTSR